MSDVHFEVFAKRPGGAMTLELSHAQEDHAVRAAEALFASGEYAGVRVVRETRDAETGAFKSAVLLKLGDQEEGKIKPGADEMGPICRQPSDFYSPQARAQVARLLEGWLAKVKATPFELMHRLDLVERLQTTGGELQHAIQKIAVPQSLGRGVGVHQVVRSLQQLVDQAVAELRADTGAGLFAETAPAQFAKACRDLRGQERAEYRLAGGVARHLAEAANWTEKAERLLDLTEAVPEEEPARALAIQVLRQPLAELLAAKAANAELIGADLDLGGSVGALLRLVAEPAMDAVTQVDADAAAAIPPLGDTARRIGARLATPGYEDLRRSLARKLLQDLAAPRRLRPSDPPGEVVLFRVIGLALGAADPRLLPPEDVREALIERSRLMVSQDFIDAFLRQERPALEEAQDLGRLLDHLAGGANRAQAARWIQASVGAQRFETELASGPEQPGARLAQLARLYRALARHRSDVGGIEPVLERLAEAADRLEAARKVVSQLGRAAAPLPHRLSALLRMAAGETAPPGPAADRAKAEARRLLNAPGAMAELAQDPATLRQLEGLMKAL
jgi:hypothetical protein